METRKPDLGQLNSPKHPSHPTSGTELSTILVLAITDNGQRRSMSSVAHRLIAGLWLFAQQLTFRIILHKLSKWTACYQGGMRISCYTCYWMKRVGASFRFLSIPSFMGLPCYLSGDAPLLRIVTPPAWEITHLSQLLHYWLPRFFVESAELLQGASSNPSYSWPVPSGFSPHCTLLCFDQQPTRVRSRLRRPLPSTPSQRGSGMSPPLHQQTYHSGPRPSSLFPLLIVKL